MCVGGLRRFNHFTCISYSVTHGNQESIVLIYIFSPFCCLSNIKSKLQFRVEELRRRHNSRCRYSLPVSTWSYYIYDTVFGLGKNVILFMILVSGQMYYFTVTCLFNSDLVSDSVTGTIVISVRLCYLGKMSLPIPS